MTSLHWQDATDLAAGIRSGRLTCVAVMDAFLRRIHSLDPSLNAFLFLISDEEALRKAAAADSGPPVGLLHGLPIAIKDLMDVEGMPTTFGASLPPRIASRDCLLAERLRAAGALIIGKTNTPEQGLGALTFNKLRDPTRNPWNLARHAGGSSGGAAAAVASGMLPFADGSDSGGSIRYPASFCNLIGLRPSPGRVPTARDFDGWSPHALLGPMARSARDAGLLLAAIAGRDSRAPLSLSEDPSTFLKVEPLRLRGLRLGWSRDLGGLPIEPSVTTVLDSMRSVLTQAGCVIEDWEPDMSTADRCWEIIELHEFMAGCAEDVRTHASELRAELVSNVRAAEKQTVEQLAWAQIERTRIYRRTAAALQRFDFLIAPATPVVAPTLDCEWVRDIHGIPQNRYFEWQRCASRITVTAHPALSVPAGFSESGLPVGLQVVGRDHGDRSLLDFAAALEELTGYGRRRPSMI